MINCVLLEIKWNHLTMCKKKTSSGWFKNVIYKIYLEIIYLVYV